MIRSLVKVLSNHGKTIIPVGASVLKQPSTTTVVHQFKRFGHGYEGNVGDNLPFQIKDRRRFSALFWLFFASGLSVPFVSVWFNMWKKSR